MRVLVFLSDLSLQIDPVKNISDEADPNLKRFKVIDNKNGDNKNLWGIMKYHNRRLKQQKFSKMIEIISLQTLPHNKYFYIQKLFCKYNLEGEKYSQHVW